MRTLPPRYRSHLVAVLATIVASYSLVGLTRPVLSLSTTTPSKIWKRRGLRTLHKSRKDDDDTRRPISIHTSLLPIHSFTHKTTHITLPKYQRVQAYCLSDMHADGGNSSNVAWLEEKCVPTRKNDDNVYSILIVPGDVANSIPSLRRCFQILKSNFDTVCYCPGNHEAWVNEEENTEEDLNEDEDEDITATTFNDEDTTETTNNASTRTSIDQLVDVFTAAKDEGIHVGPVCVTYWSDNDNDNDDNKLLWIVPLQSFYHSSWDTEPDLHHPALLAAEERRSFRKRWNDYRNMKWPEDLTTHTEFVEGDNGKGGSWTLASSFSDLNQAVLKTLADTDDKDDTTATTTILSFSHYVPRIELSPEKRFLIDPRLARVIGSNLLERDIRNLQPDLHLFGHTHIPIGMEVEGIRYAQWPLGYPKEAVLQCRTVASTGPMLVFDSILTTNGGVPSCVDAENTHWSKHYQQFDRDPNNLEPAPWLRERLERIGRRRR